MMSPLEQFKILPIFDFFFVFTNSVFIIFLGLFFFFFYVNIKNKFIPTKIQQIFEAIYSTTFELSYSNIGKNGRFFLPLIFVLFFLF